VTRLVLAACIAVAAFTAGLVPGLRAAGSADADASRSIRQFLARGIQDPPYRAMRRLEAENGQRTGWLEAVTDFSPATGFRYEVLAEGGSQYIRSRVLRALLDAERDAVARGEPARSALSFANYEFGSEGRDPSGLVRVPLTPKRNEGVLVAGSMFLTPTDGELVRVEGRLARNPSFWVKEVDIVRSYARISGAVVPVTLDTRAQLRMLGRATLRMTYEYSEINGERIGAAR
jgi:hypothetical protein